MARERHSQQIRSCNLVTPRSIFNLTVPVPLFIRAPFVDNAQVTCLVTASHQLMVDPCLSSRSSEEE